MANSPDKFFAVMEYSPTVLDWTTKLFTDEELARKYVDLGKGQRFLAEMPVTYVTQD